ncbi:MAG: flagellar basal body-associated FliL family protein [Zoogloeaceae bacterium]|jgi:flagellar FliL protein|nr:flagellar basal body-associated FliL family protein [Zoogloeaceae bacterium]
MAAKDAPAAPAGEAPKKGKKLLIIVSAIVALLIVLITALGWFFLSSPSGDDEGDEEEEEVTQTRKSKKKGDPAALPIFVGLDSFTVNLAADENGSGAFMQTTLSLEVEDLEADATLKAWMPRIRNDVTLIMSGKKESEVMSKEGKEALAQEIKDGINSIISPPKKGKAPEGPVQAVLFTQIIIQ